LGQNWVKKKSKSINFGQNAG